MTTEIDERRQSALAQAFPAHQPFQGFIDNTRARFLVFDGNARRRKLVLQNLGPDSIEYGGEDLVYGRGIRIAAGGNLLDDASTWTGTLYVASGSAAQSDVRARQEWMDAR